MVIGGNELGGRGGLGQYGGAGPASSSCAGAGPSRAGRWAGGGSLRPASCANFSISRNRATSRSVVHGPTLCTVSVRATNCVGTRGKPNVRQNLTGLLWNSFSSAARNSSPLSEMMESIVAIAAARPPTLPRGLPGPGGPPGWNLWTGCGFIALWKQGKTMLAPCRRRLARRRGFAHGAPSFVWPGQVARARCGRIGMDVPRLACGGRRGTVRSWRC